MLYRCTSSTDSRCPAGRRIRSTKCGAIVVARVTGDCVVAGQACGQWGRIGRGNAWSRFEYVTEAGKVWRRERERDGRQAESGEDEIQLNGKQDHCDMLRYKSVWALVNVCE